MAVRGLRGLAAQEGLHDDHGAAAFRARLARVRIVGFTDLGFICRSLFRLGFCIEQTPDLHDPVTTESIGHDPCVADAMEARWQDMDQEPPDELAHGQAHDLHAIAACDAVVLPAEGHRISVPTDQAMVGDRHPMRVSAEIGQHGLRPAEGWLGIHNPVSFAQWREMGCEGLGGGQSGQVPEEGQFTSLVQSG